MPEAGSFSKLGTLDTIQFLSSHQCASISIAPDYKRFLSKSRNPSQEACGSPSRKSSHACVANSPSPFTDRVFFPLARAAELAGASRYGFAELTASRQIAQHYRDDDLAQDLDYARGQ
jgi:hypothetical protein